MALLVLYELAFGTSLALSSYAPGGRNFPELTHDDRFSICKSSFDDYGRMYALAFGTFPVLSSYAPGGRNYQELTSDDRILPSIIMSLMTSQGYVCARLWNLPGTFFRRPRGRNYPELTIDDRFPPRRISLDDFCSGYALAIWNLPCTFFLRPRRKKLPGTHQT